MRKFALASIGLMALTLSSSADQPKTIMPANSSATVAAGTNQVDKVVAHLLRAADHLEAAGLNSDASRIREEAGQRAMPEGNLSRKEAELECLQHEVDRLREQAGQVPGVIVDVMVVEVDRGRLGLKAGEFDKLIGFSPIPAAPDRDLPEVEAHVLEKMCSEGTAGVVDANPALLPLFRELQERGALSIETHQSLLVRSRRPGSISSGGDFPVLGKGAGKSGPIQSLAVGAEVEVVADVLPNQRVRLQTVVSLRRVNGQRIVDAQGTVYPGISSRRLNTEVEMQIGQTLAIGRMTHDCAAEIPAATGVAAAVPQAAKNSGKPAHSAADSVETIVFVTPRLVSTAAVPRLLPIGSAEASDRSSATVDPVEFVPADGAKLGPPMPVQKRRSSPN